MVIMMINSRELTKDNVLLPLGIFYENYLGDNKLRIELSTLNSINLCHFSLYLPRFIL